MTKKYFIPDSVLPAPILSVGFRLSEEQMATASFSKGSRAIIATAGSGKTTSLSYKVASLVTYWSIPDYQVCATTFTRAAAHELKERIDKMAGRETSIKTGTIHSFCMALILRHWKKIGFSNFPSIISEKKRQVIQRNILLELYGVKSLEEISNLDEKEIPLWMSELDIRKYSDNEQDYSSQLVRKEPKAVYQKLHNLYHQQCLKFGYLDYDGILTYALELLRVAGKDLNDYLPKYLFIDEAQDLSAVQWLLVEELEKYAISIDVIGDDDQSIYAWRGATPWRFRSFFSRADHKFFLSCNRRCASKIMDLSAAVISMIPSSRRIDKMLVPAREEAGEVRFSVLLKSVEESGFIIARKILTEVQEKKAKFSDYAFISRNRKVFDELKEVFKIHKVPYHMLGGEKQFFDSNESNLLKDLLYLSLLREEGFLEPREHWLSLLMEVGISSSMSEKILESCRDHSYSLDSIFWAVENQRMHQINKDFAKKMIRFIEKIRKLDEVTFAYILNNDDFSHIISFFIEKKVKDQIEEKLKKHQIGKIQAENDLKRKYKEKVEEFFNFYRPYEKYDLIEIASYLGVNDDVKRDDNKEDAVTMTTAHSSKGLEWNTVYVMNCNDANWPSARAGRELGSVPEKIYQEILDEERRLLYVAMTRAKNNLYLISTLEQKSFFEKEGSIQQPSRFFPLFFRDKMMACFRQVNKDKKTAGLTLNEFIGVEVKKKTEHEPEEKKELVVHKRDKERKVIRRDGSSEQESKDEKK